MKRGICVAFAAILLLATPTSAKADVYWPEGPSIYTECAMVIEVNSGAVLYEKDSDRVSYPASITKVLTTLLALEHSELDEVVTFSDDAINLNQGDTSHIARDYGEQMTMKECLYAVMLESANECAYAVAEHVGQKLGGNYQTFIDLMNEKAKSLGCTNTQFTNANGLPDENHWTSAHDMALISAEAYRNENFRIIVGTRSYKIPPTNKHDEITPLNNHHAMISNYKTRKYLYEYCTGGKTGYTQAAGSTLVTFAEKDGLVLVCVVMRTNGSDQYIETTSLMEHCFQNFQKVDIGDNGSVEDEKDENNGFMANYSPFVKLDENAQIVLPITADISDVEMSLDKAGLSEESIARLKYTYGGHTVGTADVVLSNVKVEDEYFNGQEQNQEQEKEEPTDMNIIVIKPFYILLGVGGLVGIIVIILIIKRLYDNFYVIRHDMEVRKQRRERFRIISRRKKRWKKKDRMFK